MTTRFGLRTVPAVVRIVDFACDTWPYKPPIADVDVTLNVALLYVCDVALASACVMTYTSNFWGVSRAATDPR